jgi:hypothetical protein
VSFRDLLCILALRVMGVAFKRELEYPINPPALKYSSKLAWYSASHRLYYTVVMITWTIQSGSLLTGVFSPLDKAERQCESGSAVKIAAFDLVRCPLVSIGLTY